MAAAEEFLEDYGGRHRNPWPAALAASDRGTGSVAGRLKPGAKVHSVAARPWLGASHRSEWRGRARDGSLTLPAVEDDGVCLVPIVLSAGGVVALPPPPARAPPGSSAIAMEQVATRPR